MTDLHTIVDRRQVGPVTMATGGGAAVATLIAWLLDTVAGIQLPPLEQGALTLVLIMLAGWSVNPKGRRSK